MTLFCTPAGNPDIGDAGLAAVAEGLQSNSNLTTVELDGTWAWLMGSMDRVESCERQRLDVCVCVCVCVDQTAV